MRKRKIMYFLCVGLSLIMIMAISPTNRFFEISKNLEIYSSLFKVINKTYVEKVVPAHLLNSTVEPMLKSLDPYTVYISEDKIEEVRTMNTMQYGGIGTSTIRLNRKVFISSIIEGSPADSANLEIGDEIITVSGLSVNDKSNEELSQLVKGQINTIITLGIRKNGSEKTEEVAITRSKVTLKNIPYYGMLKESIGYIKHVQFVKNSSQNITKAFKELKKKGATSLILDIRNNPGGLLHEAVNICNLFIEKNKLIVETKGKKIENTVQFKTLNKPIDTKIPVAILVNHLSASASEIVAGTLQDYDRAIILGQKSYGKGLVQKIKPLSYNTQLKVTIARYYTASGRDIQAIDYRKKSNKENITDSLKKVYKTVNGRIVYEGGGIYPDIYIEKIKLPELIAQLVKEGKIYSYANEFKLKNKSIALPKDFNISDEQFDDFINWLLTFDLKYESLFLKKLKKIEALSKEESKQSLLFYKTIAEIIDATYKPLKEQLYAEKNLLKNLLEVEISLRYYGKVGGIKAALEDDLEVRKAISILSNFNEYNRILNKPIEKKN